MGGFHGYAKGCLHSSQRQREKKAQRIPHERFLWARSGSGTHYFCSLHELELSHMSLPKCKGGQETVGLQVQEEEETEFRVS